MNLSAGTFGKLHSWLPHDLQAEQVVFLPDACPGKFCLPTGTAVLDTPQLTAQVRRVRLRVRDEACAFLGTTE